jgi:methylmalonyl-CoA/ethylmalonyl-CoA epimerase
VAADSSPVAIDHVGLAVADLEASVAFYRQLLGREPSHREEVAQDGVEAAFFDLGASSLELLSSTDPNSSVGRFLERRGQGLHHMAYLVPDLEAELHRWASWGAELVDRQPRPGARGRLVAFIHPKSADGVLIELCQLRTEPT